MIDLKHNQLKSIPHNAFDKLRNLTTVSISNNKIKSVHKDAFFKNPELRVIHALDSPISNLTENLADGLFRSNKKLKCVSLEDGIILQQYEFSFFSIGSECNLPDDNEFIDKLSTDQK